MEQDTISVPSLPPAMSWLKPAERAPSPPSFEEQEGLSTWTGTDRPYRLLQDMPACSHRLSRMTFALVDGQRTVQEIADLLHKTCEQMSPILNACYRSGWIGKPHHS
ncbi:hypothetical protein [Ktedonobacter racemifer]|uniref:hypothetical protein n=1 Tax=Ktedonobacter racemifer TaxID=363277 RepID=UPI00146DAB6B|nr:hypothetical protein [Ktedonobacter racemifer]